MRNASNFPDYLNNTDNGLRVNRNVFDSKIFTIGCYMILIKLSKKIFLNLLPFISLFLFFSRNAFLMEKISHRTYVLTNYCEKVSRHLKKDFHYPQTLKTDVIIKTFFTNLNVTEKEIF